MKLKVKRLFLACILSTLLIFTLAGGAQAFSTCSTYSNVLAFGDSLSDNGYETDGIGLATMTNGDVWVEYLADNLDASLYDLAFSGATSGTDNPAAASAGYGYTGLQWQVGYYGATSGYTIAQDTLVTISAGGNDMFQYFINDTTPTVAEIYQSATLAASNVADAITTLSTFGGTDFMVMNLSTTQQEAGVAYWMTVFNSALAAEMAALSADPDLNLFLLDLSDFVAEADNYEDTWVTACSTDPEACEGITYAWWDTVGVHPTTEVHKQIAELATNMVAPVPEPGTVFLLLTGLAGLAGVRRKRK